MKGIPLDRPFKVGRPRRDPRERILERLDHELPDRKPDKCWEWPGDRTEAGYGVINVGGHRAGPDDNRQVLYVHRIMARAPEGKVAMHTCDNPPCCNPRHLWIGTVADNNLDSQIKGRSRAWGHVVPRWEIEIVDE